jgi:A/G-specific adenine glycosylase
VRAVAVWLQRGGRVLAVRREAGGLLGGLWELPGGDLGPKERPGDGVPRLLQERLGITAEQVAAAGRVKHAFTHRDLTLHVFRASALPGRVRRQGLAQHRWVPRAAFRALPRATVTRKAFAALGEEET